MCLQSQINMYALTYVCECIMRNILRVIFINGKSSRRVLLMKKLRKNDLIMHDILYVDVFNACTNDEKFSRFLVPSDLSKNVNDEISSLLL